ncbi:FUSC family protein (plasmid) [Erwinia rhapontici]|uniref:FUSC family protein n=1 Tax=Erwinia rhapontici TaxID=55212 RepID=UPI003D35E514
MKPRLRNRNLRNDLLLGLCCLPALIMIGLAADLTGHYQEGGMAASGALPLAFGANKRFEGSSFRLLMLTVVGLTLSGWLGSLVGDNFPTYVCLAVFYGGLYSLFTGTDNGLSWCVLQSAIVFMMAGHFHGNGTDALMRGELTGAGALLQLFFLVLFARKNTLGHKDVNSPGQISHLSGLHRLHLRWSVLFTMPAIAVALVVAERAESFSGYWAGMTLLLCLRSNYRESFRRVPARIVGTVGGVWLASYITTLNDTPAFVFAAFIITGYFALSYSFTLSSRSYLIFTFFVSLMVIFLMESQQQNMAASRIFATLTGGTCAFSALICSYLTAKLYFYQKRKKSNQH